MPGVPSTMLVVTGISWRSIIHTMHAQFAFQDRRFDSLTTMMDERFKTLSTRLDERFDSLEKIVDVRLGATNQRIGALETDMTIIKSHLLKGSASRA